MSEGELTSFLSKDKRLTLVLFEKQPAIHSATGAEELWSRGFITSLVSPKGLKMKCSISCVKLVYCTNVRR